MDDTADIAQPSGRRPPQQNRASRKPDDLKLYRERLVNGNEIKPEFEYELLAMYARNETSAPLAMPALCILFSIASMFWASWAEAGAWIAAVIAPSSRARAARGGWIPRT